MFFKSSFRDKKSLVGQADLTVIAHCNKAIFTKFDYWILGNLKLNCQEVKDSKVLMDIVS